MSERIVQRVLRVSYLVQGVVGVSQGEDGGVFEERRQVYDVLVQNYVPDQLEGPN